MGCTDLTPLAGLTQLQELDLSQFPASMVNRLVSQVTPNQLRDVSPLANLTALHQLNLSDTQVSDLTPLLNLSALRTLYLYNSQVSDESVAALQHALPGLAVRR